MSVKKDWEFVKNAANLNLSTAKDVQVQEVFEELRLIAKDAGAGNMDLMLAAMAEIRRFNAELEKRGL